MIFFFSTREISLYDPRERKVEKLFFILLLSSSRIDRGEKKVLSMNSPVGITYNFTRIDGAQDIVEFAMGHIPAVKSFQPISFFILKKKEDGFELSMKEGA